HLPSTATSTAAAAGEEARRIAALPGVAHVEPIQHRFVYVGADLQDLYGVDPRTIGTAAKLQDAYFAGGSAHQLLDRLAREPDAAAARLRAAAGPGATVTDIDENRRVVGSSLTAVDLRGLTRVELGYAVVLAAAATGLVLGMGFAARRRSFAIIAALGARPSQI